MVRGIDTRTDRRSQGPCFISVPDVEGDVPYRSVSTGVDVGRSDPDSKRRHRRHRLDVVDKLRVAAGGHMGHTLICPIGCYFSPFRRADNRSITREGELLLTSPRFEGRSVLATGEERGLASVARLKVLQRLLRRSDDLVGAGGSQQEEWKEYQGMDWDAHDVAPFTEKQASPWHLSSPGSISLTLTPGRRMPPGRVPVCGGASAGRVRRLCMAREENFPLRIRNSRL